MSSAFLQTKKLSQESFLMSFMKNFFFKWIFEISFDGPKNCFYVTGQLKNYNVKKDMCKPLTTPTKIRNRGE